MSTLILVGNSESSRRCDAHCYDAQSNDCECVCGGANHGVGEGQAHTNTYQMAKKILKEFGKENVRLAKPMQLELPGIANG